MTGFTCIACGGAADGLLRAALWREEEKGRLVAQSVSLCPACHRAFLEGSLPRVELARKYHAALGYEPAEWIGRIDRDTLLDIACLRCGVLLPVASPEADRILCPQCKAENLVAERRTKAGAFRITSQLAILLPGEDSHG